MSKKSDDDPGQSGYKTNSKLKTDNTLQNAWTGNCDHLVLSRSDLKHLAALEKAYQDLYLPLFPPSAGYDSLEKWLGCMNDPCSPIDFRISVVGHNLRSGNKDEIVIKGICVGAYFKDSDAGYLGYIAVDKASRAEGLGNALFRQFQSSMLQAARENGGVLKGLFLDCDKPSSDHSCDGYDAQKRIDKYIKWGGKEIECTYRLPIVLDPKQKVDSLRLISFNHPVTGEQPEARTVVALIRSLYKDNGVPNPDGDLDFRRIAKELTEAENRARNPIAPKKQEPLQAMRFYGLKPFGGP